MILFLIVAVSLAAAAACFVALTGTSGETPTFQPARVERVERYHPELMPGAYRRSTRGPR